jgi:hypothetical protein
MYFCQAFSLTNDIGCNTVRISRGPYFECGLEWSATLAASALCLKGNCGML